MCPRPRICQRLVGAEWRVSRLEVFFVFREIERTSHDSILVAHKKRCNGERDSILWRPSSTIVSHLSRVCSFASSWSRLISSLLWYFRHISTKPSVVYFHDAPTTGWSCFSRVGDHVSDMSGVASQECTRVVRTVYSCTLCACEFLLTARYIIDIMHLHIWNFELTCPHI